MADVKILVPDAVELALVLALLVVEHVVASAHLAQVHAAVLVVDALVALPVLGRAKTPVMGVQGAHLVLELVKVLVKERANQAVLRVVNQDVKTLVFQPVLRLA